MYNNEIGKNLLLGRNEIDLTIFRNGRVRAPLGRPAVREMMLVSARKPGDQAIRITDQPFRLILVFITRKSKAALTWLLSVATF